MRLSPEGTDGRGGLIKRINHHPVFALASDSKNHILHVLSEKIIKPDTSVFVSLDGATIAGMLIASYARGSEAFVLHKKGYIGETVVQNSYRGKGIGEELFKRAEEWLHERGADHIELQVSVENIKAKQFWEGMGFTQSTYHMIKKL